MNLTDQALLGGGIQCVLKSRRIFPSPNHCLSNSSNSRWQISLNQSDPMPATLNIDQIISLPLVVSKTDSLFSPASVKASGGVFILLYKTPPSIEYHLPAYFTLRVHIKSPTYLQPGPKTPSCIQPTTSNKETPDFFISRETEKKKEKGKKKKERNGIRPCLRRRPSQSGLQHAYWLVRNQSWRLWVSLSDFCAIF